HNRSDPRDIVDGHREKRSACCVRCLARFSLAEDPGLVAASLRDPRSSPRTPHPGAACPPAPADPSPASLLPCWAACVAPSRLGRRAGRLTGRGRQVALSCGRTAACCLAPAGAALAGSLLNLNARVPSARVIQAAWRRRCASLAGPPAAQEDRVDALPAKSRQPIQHRLCCRARRAGQQCHADTPSRCLLDVQAIRRAQAASAIQRWFRRARQIRIGRIRREIERRRRRRAILVIVTNYQISRRNRFFALLQDHVTRWLANRQAAGRRIQQKIEQERLERPVTGCQPGFNGLARPRCQGGSCGIGVPGPPSLCRRLSVACGSAPAARWPPCHSFVAGFPPPTPTPRRNPERLLLARPRSALRFARQQLRRRPLAQQLADLRAGTSHSAKAVRTAVQPVRRCRSPVLTHGRLQPKSYPTSTFVLHSVQILHNLIRPLGTAATAQAVARECPVKAGDVLTDALVSGAVVRPSPLQQELVKASAWPAGLSGLPAPQAFSADSPCPGALLSACAKPATRCCAGAGLEERRLVSQSRASGALLVRVEPDWPNGRLRQRLAQVTHAGGGAWLSAFGAGQRRLLGSQLAALGLMRLCSCCFSSAVSASAVGACPPPMASRMPRASLAAAAPSWTVACDFFGLVSPQLASLSCTFLQLLQGAQRFEGAPASAGLARARPRIPWRRTSCGGDSGDLRQGCASCTFEVRAMAFTVSF
uniref:Lipoyl-binding domain-containing protein n=1 Tax=Macrostomum lignano TaxID=282301 RepID=A0A1I8FCG9_9PLAT